MSLEAGWKLAHYEIVEPIGRGGMGEVFRARDTKLGRDVAIKVLPEAFARDKERVARFKREAKVLASLNHPNIAAIHGLEESDGTHYLVLELVPGETLAERIARGPIPLDEAIAIATKIAEGLEEAHERGIVHRDLKPANIKLAPDDKVKILDFGLAKAFLDEAPVTDDSMSPTITRDATRAGVILGTAAYMSPEQAKGKRVDRRTDIFALGSVLLEMLTGKKAFRGEGVSETLAAVMKDEPDWDLLPRDASIHRVVRRCLAKPVKDRFQHVGDVRIELGERPHEPTSAVANPNPWLSRVAIFLAGVAVAATGSFVSRPEAEDVQAVRRWRIAIPPGASLGELELGNTSPALAISPSGGHIAYVAKSEDKAQLYLKTVGELDAIPVEGGENARTPFFSPDGRALGFLSASGTLMRVSLQGGAPVAISAAGVSVRGASWSPDGSIFFSANESGGLVRVPATDGELEVLIVPERAEGLRAYRLPETLPDGEVVLLTVVGLYEDSVDDARLSAFWPKSGEMRVLIEGGASARYSPTGHLVYARAGALYAVPFDADDVVVTGDPVRVLDGVATYPTMGPAEFSLSRDGSLLYAPGGPLGTRYRVVWVDRTGVSSMLVDEPRPYVTPKLSPDGRSLIVTSNDVNMNFWRYDIAQGALTRMVSGSNHSTPIWAPDGASITFSSDREGSYDLYSIAADGGGQARKLVDIETEFGVPLSWAPDGRTLVFNQYGGVRNGIDLWLWNQDGTTSPLLATTANEIRASIAPNGRWIAYESDESGRREVFVGTFPEMEARRRVSVDGGTEPRWNPNGRELFYRNGYKMMVVDVVPGDDLAMGRPRLLFESDAHATFSQATSVGTYDVGPDGERFAMIDQTDAPLPPTELVLVQNWAEELKRLVPADH